MRTKTLLVAAAALSAGLLASSAQVYSANIVGYVNTKFDSGFTLASNPLKGTDNLLGTIIPVAPDGTTVYRWDAIASDFSAQTYTYYAGSPGFWDPNVVINPGEGFMVYAPEVFTNTFVGEVMTGLVTNQVPTGFSMLASIPPIGGNVTNVVVGLPALDGDTIYKWDFATQDYLQTATFYDGAPGYWDPYSLQIGVGEGFLYYRTGAATAWVRNFVVQ